MKYTTIQVTPKMRRRLAGYKLPGMSYERVIEGLTDAVSPEQFRAIHGRAVALTRADLRAAADRAEGSGVAGRYEAAAEEGRRVQAERLARMTPGQRMEAAYRLYETVRGRR